MSPGFRLAPWTAAPLALCAMLTLGANQPAQAQQVVFLGRGQLELDERIRHVLDSAEYLRITRDTLIAASDTIPNSVLVVGATVRVEGTIRGDVVIVDANFFTRPGSRITGNVINIAGGYYPSDRAILEGEVDDHPNAPYDVVYEDDVRRIIGTRRSTLLELDGFRGIRVPRYDRVDGLSVGLGAGYLLPAIGPVEPMVHAWAEYHTQPGDIGGGGDLALLRGDLALRFGAERITATNEGWIRNALHNSVSYLILGKDYRDYYRADRFFVSGSWLQERPARTLEFELRAQREDARPIPAAGPWTFVEPDSVRPNRNVIASSITSAIASGGIDIERATFVAEATAEVEVAATTLSGDYSFARFAADADWAVPALLDHTLSFEAHFQTPLPGSDPLPLQRWSFVGGSGTLWTFEQAQFMGDHVAYLETAYSIPLPSALRLPFFGTLTLDLLHRVGMAWTEADTRDFEQNVGARIGTAVLWARVVTNPRNFSDDAEFGVGLRLPKRYPWQSRQEGDAPDR